MASRECSVRLKSIVMHTFCASLEKVSGQSSAFLCSYLFNACWPPFQALHCISGGPTIKGSIGTVPVEWGGVSTTTLLSLLSPALEGWAGSVQWPTGFQKCSENIRKLLINTSGFHWKTEKQVLFQSIWIPSKHYWCTTKGHTRGA